MIQITRWDRRRNLIVRKMMKSFFQRDKDRPWSEIGHILPVHSKSHQFVKSLLNSHYYPNPPLRHHHNPNQIKTKMILMTNKNSMKKLSNISLRKFRNVLVKSILRLAAPPKTIRTTLWKILNIMSSHLYHLYSITSSNSSSICSFLLLHYLNS